MSLEGPRVSASAYDMIMGLTPNAPARSVPRVSASAYDMVMGSNPIAPTYSMRIPQHRPPSAYDMPFNMNKKQNALSINEQQRMSINRFIWPRNVETVAYSFNLSTQEYLNKVDMK